MSIKRLALIMLSALAVIIAAVLILASLLDLRPYRGVIAKRIEQSTGREVTWTGNLELELFPSPRAVLEDITIANADWGQKRPLLSMKRAEVGVDLWALLGGTLRYQQLVLVEPKLWLEVHPVHGPNWLFETSQPPRNETTADNSAIMDMVRLDVQDGVVEHQADGQNLLVKLHSIKVLKEDGGLNWDLIGEVDGLALFLKGDSSAFPAYRSREPFEFHWTLGSGDISLSADGSIRQKNAVDNGFPIVARLVAEKIDLGELATTIKSQPTGRLFPDTPLPVTFLRNLDADIDVSIEQLRVAGMSFDRIRTKLQAHHGRLRMAPLRSILADGELIATLGLDVNGEPRLDGDLRGQDIKLGSVVNDAAGADVMEGALTRIDMKVYGSGGSVRDIMAALNGHLAVDVGDGQIKDSSLDWAGGDLMFQTLRQLDGSSAEKVPVKLHCAVMRFAIANGIATTDKGLALETERTTVVGGGTIDLGTERLDIGLRPYAKEGLGFGAGSLAEMVRIGGTLSEPTPAIDAAGVAKQGASVGAALLTGGLSLLAEGVYNYATADDNPCQTARAGYQDSAQAGQDSTVRSKRQRVAEKKQNMLESTLSNLFDGGSSPQSTTAGKKDD